MRASDFMRLAMLVVAAAVVAAASPARAFAEKVAAPETHDAEHKSAGHGGGHEEEAGGLAFTSIHRWDLGIWTLVVFGILIFVLSKFAWPHIKEGLEKREANIRNAHEEAKKDRIAAEAKLTEAKRQLDEAALQAKAILDEARKAADALRANEREAGVKEAEAKKQQAEREIASSREAMIKDLYDKAVQLATLMSEKALRREISIADQGRLLDESLAELRTANKA